MLYIMLIRYDKIVNMYLGKSCIQDVRSKCFNVKLVTGKIWPTQIKWTSLG